jgi:predicted  nucleic acid-binding Zn-ribbon protein
MQGFRELVQLHLANEADRKAAKRQEELRKEIAELEEGVTRARGLLELAESDVKRLHLERKAAELDVQKLEDQRAKYRAQLMTAKTNEIYRTLISEIETTARMISEKETLVLQIMEAAEAAAAAAAEAKKDLAKAETMRGVEERKLQADVESLQAERVQAQARSAEITPKIERALLLQYKRISEGRDGRGMALGVDYTCTECHMTIPPQEWVELIDPQKPALCQGCKRILYRAESAT